MYADKVEAENTALQKDAERWKGERDTWCKAYHNIMTKGDPQVTALKKRIDAAIAWAESLEATVSKNEIIKALSEDTEPGI